MPKVELQIETFVDRQYVSYRAYEELETELEGLRKDVKELRGNKALLDSEVEEIARLRVEHLQMQDDINKLALFLRDHYKNEIALGQHLGVSLVDVVSRYLGRERMYAKDQISREIPEPAKVAKVKQRVAK
jgi:hypothetical protein